MRETKEKGNAAAGHDDDSRLIEFMELIEDAEDLEDDGPTTTSDKTMDEAVNDALMDKLRICASKPQEGTETVRSVAAKLHARVTSSDRRTRERTLEKLWRKNSSAIETFLKILEGCKDHAANCSIAGILHECISPKIARTKSKGCRNRSAIGNNSRMAIDQLIDLGGTQVLIRLLNALQNRETITSEVLAQEILWILGQVAQKDKKFASKAKLLNSTKIFHSLLKVNYNNSRTLLPLLLTVKTLAKNPSTLQILVKDGIVSTLEKTFVCIGYAPQLRLKTLLESFKYFTVSRLCCTKFVKIGLVHLLTRLFERWERFDGPVRLKICNYCLNTLQHLCVIKSGRKAIKSNGGLQLLYRFCTSCPEEKPYDHLLSRVCGIVNQCLERRELPVPEMSPVRFALPEASVGKASNSAESGSDADSRMNSVASFDRLCSDAEDSCDNEESDDPRTRRAGKPETGGEPDEEKFFAGVVDRQKSEEELLAYSRFFGELGSLQAQLSSVVRGTGAANPSESAEVGVAGPRGRRVSESRIVDPGIEGLRTFAGISTRATDRQAYCAVASGVRSVTSFAKVAYPDLTGGDGLGRAAPLNGKDRKVCRSKLLTCIDRGLHPGSLARETTTYDLDQLAGEFSPPPGDSRLLCNRDEERVGKRYGDSKRLRFESRFESGNLRRAVQITAREYDLILTPDVNSGSRHQWFYFEVSNMEASLPYTFNIINCEKANSQFNFGMKPILFSVREAQLGRPGWVRTGTDICYYRNCYQRPGKEKNYLTTSFAVAFPHACDVCYLAYHFPYTFSRLMTNIRNWSSRSAPGSVYFRAEPLCDTLNGNENPVLTITAPESTSNPIQNRKIVFLTSRVHPGESNASWVMHGTLETLLADSTYAKSLREDYLFKVVPMLNIEGVVNGCNRYGLTNEDLNRRWSNPNRVLHPVIFHAKGLMEYCAKVLRKPPHVFVDYHGHSRRKNVFLFGCSRSGSWSAADRAKPDEPVQYLTLPHLMQKTSPAFALPLCSFKIVRNKESTARVAVWRQLGVTRSYTMESSFCGCDQGSLAGLHFDTKHLRDVGQDFCRALAMMKDGSDEWTIDEIAAAEDDDDETTSGSASDESELDD